jgi:hypothetical protein
VSEKKETLTLYQPVLYQVEVPGHMDRESAAWIGEIAIRTGLDARENPVTTLITRCDQSALIGLLRRLNSLGLPIIAVNILEDDNFRI